MKQGTKEWREARKSHIGASDAPVIMNVCPFTRSDGFPRTPLTLWKEKLDILGDDKPTSAMNYGLEAEHNIRQMVNETTGKTFDPAVFFHPEMPFMMASLDGITGDKQYILEIKTCGDADFALAEKGEVPEKYFPQVQHQLMCVPVAQCVLYVVSHRDTKETKTIEITPDSAYQNKLVAKEKEFWSCVLNFKQPEATERDYHERDKVWYQKAKELYAIKERIRQLKEDEKSWEQELRNLSNGENSFFENLRYTLSMRKGTVDYSKIPELQKVDVESYRKAPTPSWRLSAR